MKVYTELSLRLASTRMLKSGEHFPLIGKSLYRDNMAETTFVPCAKRQEHILCCLEVSNVIVNCNIVCLQYRY